MKTEQISVYTFDELKEDVKKKVIAKYRDINVYGDWHEFIIEDLKEELKGYGITFKNVYFDFDRNRYMQISEAYISDYALFLKKMKVNKVILKEVIDGNIRIDINEDRERINTFNINDDTEKQILSNKRIKRQLVEEALNDWLSDILHKYLKRLEEEYDYSLSDDAVIETIKINEFEFLEDGRRF